MRVAVNRFVLFCAVLAVPALLEVRAARAEGSGQQGADHFVPSLLVKSGVTGQVWDATVRSEICRGCTLPNPAAQPLRSSESGDDFDVSPFVGGVLEVMTPELSVFGSPRLFVGGEFAGSFGVDRRIAREGDPGTVSNPIPPLPSGQPSPTGFDENAVLGQGSETTATMGDYIYGAHAGVAIPFELWGRALRVRATVGWMRYEVDLEGIVVDAECTPSGTTTECNPLNTQRPGGFLRAVTLTGSASEEFDGIGPGLDIEMDTGRFGPVGSSILLGVQAYRIIGDRTVDFSSPVVSVSDSLGNDQNQAHFGFEADEWMYRLGAGLRLYWLGFEE